VARLPDAKKGPRWFGKFTTPYLAKVFRLVLGLTSLLSEVSRNDVGMAKNLVVRRVSFVNMLASTQDERQKSFLLRKPNGLYCTT
jgi:hypothetical protein